MNALRFTCPESSTIVFACGGCRTVVSSTKLFGDGPEAEMPARELAERHCEPRTCGICKLPLSEGVEHLACQRQRDEEREKARFAKATKIPLHEYDGEYLYLDSWTGDGYVPTGYVEEEIAYSDAEMPRYAYACVPVKLPKPSADDWVMGLLEEGEMHEDASDQIVGLDELQAALDAWHAKQTVTSYMVDLSRVILLDAIIERLEGERRDRV